MQIDEPESPIADHQVQPHGEIIATDTSDTAEVRDDVSEGGFSGFESEEIDEARKRVDEVSEEIDKMSKTPTRDRPGPRTAKILALAKLRQQASDDLAESQ